MTVSTGGVSVSAPKAGTNLETMLAIALDPKKTSEHLAELTAATAEHIKVAGGRAKIEQADRLLAEAQQERAKARASVANAKERAEVVDAEARERAESIIASAKREAERQRKLIRQAQNRLKSRETEIKSKEDEIEPLHEEADKRLRVAENRVAQAERTKSSYEERIRGLKAALKEAER